MSEVTELEAKEPPKSFNEKVWMTFSRIDVDDLLEKKGDKKKFDYLPWASAWRIVMELFPESYFGFDDPHFFGNGTGEQWITVTIKDGCNEMVRRWWLPFMDYKNSPIVDPSSFQINTTRMRVLVKCLAMCGLGLDVFIGEDVPDKSHDAKPTSVRRIMLEELDYDETICADWIEKLREIMPNKDGIDQTALVRAYEEFSRLGDTTVAIFQGLESWQRTAIHKVRKEVHEAQRKEAVASIQSEEPPANAP